MTTTDHPSLAAALAAFQAEMPTVAKTKRANAGSYGYTYADLATICEVAMPRLAAHGLSFTCAPRRIEGTPAYELVGTLRHTSGDTDQGALPVDGRDQKLGISITYARRYLLSSMTGIVTDDDTDGLLVEAQQDERKARKVTRTMSRSRPAQSSGDETEVQNADAGPELRTEAQSRALFAALRDVGITDRAEGLQYISTIVEREVDSTKTLTKREAAKVLDALLKPKE